MKNKGLLLLKCCRYLSMAMLNLRINDMITQLNNVMKAILDENNSLKQENAELRAKPQTASQQTSKQ
ncbi:MAG: hypothetical protein ABSG33_12110 [Candidatus Bathyarchaeia archaeon]